MRDVALIFGAVSAVCVIAQFVGVVLSMYRSLPHWLVTVGVVAALSGVTAVVLYVVVDRPIAAAFHAFSLYFIAQNTGRIAAEQA